MKHLDKIGVCIFAASLNSPVALAQSHSKPPEETAVELKAFTAQANFMSVGGYLRYENHLHSGEWKPFCDFGFADDRSRITCSESQVKIDFGNQGLIGDVGAMNIEAIRVLSELIKALPETNRYLLSWSYFVSFDEGDTSRPVEYGVLYDRADGILEEADGNRTHVADAVVFGINDKYQASGLTVQ